MGNRDKAGTRGACGKSLKGSRIFLAGFWDGNKERPEKN